MARRTTPAPRMADLEALLLRDYELNGHRSVRRATGALAHLRSFSGPIDPELTYDASMRYFVARRAQGAAPATIRYELAVLGRALTLGVRVGLLGTRPPLAHPTVRNVRQGFVTVEGLTRILRELPQPVRDMALWAYITGWRLGEITGLTWDRVEWSAGIARLEPGTTKNSEGRQYPFGAHPKLRALMARRLSQRLGPFVFHRRGKPVLDLRGSWKSACRAAGLGSTLFHDLRRSAVRNMERAGVPRSVAMQLTGHRTESIYRRYAITNEADLSRGVRLVARLTERNGIDGDEEEADREEA